MSDVADVDLEVEFVEISPASDAASDPAKILRRRRRMRSIGQFLVLVLIAVPGFWWAATRTDSARTAAASISAAEPDNNNPFGNPFGFDDGMVFDEFGNPTEPEGQMTVGPDGDLTADLRVRRDEVGTFDGEVNEVPNTITIDFTADDRVTVAVEQVAGLADLSGVRILDPDGDVIEELDGFSGPSVERHEFVVADSGEHSIELTGADNGLSVSYALSVERQS